MRCTDVVVVWTVGRQQFLVVGPSQAAPYRHTSQSGAVHSIVGAVSQSVASNLAQALKEALTLHRQGELSRAEKIYARILKARRDHFDALHLLGTLKHQTGKAGELKNLAGAVTDTWWRVSWVVGGASLFVVSVGIA